MLKRLLVALATMFETPLGMVWRFDRDRFSARIFSRGHFVMVPRIMGAAFGDLQAPLPAAILAASATATTELGTVPSQESSGTFAVTKLSFSTITAVTGTGATGAGATAQFRRTPAAGGAAVVLGSIQMNTGVNTVAETELNVPINAGVSLVDGDVIDFQWVQGATGLALPAGEAKVEFA